MDKPTATINVIFYLAFPVLIVLYTIYRFGFQKSSISRRSNNSRASDGTIPDVRERMRLFNDRKAALMAKARETYLKKHPNATINT